MIAGNLVWRADVGRGQVWESEYVVVVSVWAWFTYSMILWFNSQKKIYINIYHVLYQILFNIPFYGTWNRYKFYFEQIVKNIFSCFININESTIIPLNNTVKYDSLFKY